jgi:hypothetical protein
MSYYLHVYVFFLNNMDFEVLILVYLFLEYEFTVVYKLSKTHVVIDVLSRLLDNSKPLGVPY